MVKIKVKKKMTLLELIEWGWDNNVRGQLFVGSKQGMVEFGSRGWVSNDPIEYDETFTVDVEEKITEETVIPDLIELFEHTRGIDAVAHSNTSIHQLIRESDEDAMSAISFYMLNDDMTLTLLWKNGEMVE